MSPAGFTVLGTLVFGLVFAPMTTGGDDPASQGSSDRSVRGGPALDSNAGRGSRRERVYYQSPQGPFADVLADETSPFARRTDRPIIDRHTTQPAFDHASDPGTTQSPGSQGRFSNSRNNNNRHGHPQQQTQRQQPLHPAAHSNTQRRGQSAQSQRPSRTNATSHRPVPNRPVRINWTYSSSSDTPGSPRGATSNQRPQQNRRARPNQPMTTPQRNTGQRPGPAPKHQHAPQPGNARNGHADAASGSSRPGRRPIDPNAAKIPAPGSNFAEAFAEDGRRAADGSTRPAPSASANPRSDKSSQGPRE